MSSLLRKLICSSVCLALVSGLAFWQTTAKPDAAPPFAHWLFDAAHLRDRQVKAQVGELSGTLLGEPQLLTDPPALEFRNENDGVLIAKEVKDDAAFLPREALTVSAWVRLDRPSFLGGIVCLAEQHFDRSSGFVLGYTHNRFHFALATTEPERTQPMTSVTSRLRYELGRWYHVVGTYDGRTTNLYVNGQLEASSTAGYGRIHYEGKGVFLLGRYRDGEDDYPMQGALHEVMLHGRALSAEQVAAQFARSRELAARAAAPPPPHFVVAPYLQFGTTDAMTVMWETSVPGTGIVEYATQPLLWKKVESETKAATIHEVRLTDLRPNTKYYYRVRTGLANGTELTSQTRTFQTAVGPEDPFTFVLIGDTQKNPLVTHRVARLAWDRRPHFVVHLGDVVDSGPDKKEWEEELFRPCLDLFGRVPVYPCIGNHEKDHPWYYRYFSLPKPEYYYRYRYGNADFFVIDSNRPMKPGSEQYVWLDRELGQSNATWKFVYHHHPAYSSDDNDYGDTWNGPSTYGDPKVKDLVPLYEKHNVDLVFNGHVHVYERSRPIRAGKLDREKGVRYITSGGGGGILENFAPTPTWFREQVRVDYHFCQLHIDRGQLDFKAYDQRGQLFDFFSVRK